MPSKLQMLTSTPTEYPPGTGHGTDTEDGDCKMSSFPDEVLEHVLAFVTAHRDRNAVSLVCKAWYRAEAWSRRSVFIGNCYSVSPEMMASRFPRVRSLTLKGKPRFADFNFVPQNWGADVYPWVLELAKTGPFLEELRLKRMTVTDQSLALMAHYFPNFRVLVMTLCDGFSTDGLALICRNCRHLEELDLQESVVDECDESWINCFPETCTSLTSLNISCLSDEVDFGSLEKLVGRCTNLKSLKLNRTVTLDQMQQLLIRAPYLSELGTGSFFEDLSLTQIIELTNVVNKCKNLRNLSGFWEVVPLYLPVIYPLCWNLNYLNLSYAAIPSSEFEKLISHCSTLQRLWVQDLVMDRGLKAVASVCKDLRELRVFPADPEGRGNVTESGILAISEGCPNLNYVLYFCLQMTNAALEAVARNCPKFTHFRLCIITPRERDCITNEPMDEGFGAIVKNCKNLQRLAVSGLLTDKAFEYIGRYGKNIQSLSVAFAGDSDLGMQLVLLGCEKLRKLEIRDSPFGDRALWSGLHRYPSMRSLWMSTCAVTVLGCRLLAKWMPLLNVEIIKENEDTDYKVDKLYVYRTVAGPRIDSPPFVYTM
eukprot:c28536_g2_i1 orf=489-2273(-)